MSEFVHRCTADLFLLSEDHLDGPLEKAGRQPGQQLSEATLQRCNLVSGQAFDKSMGQCLLRSPQGFGLDAMQACQRCTNGLCAAEIELLREQKFDDLLGQFAEALPYFRRGEGHETGLRNRRMPAVGDGLATTVQNPQKLRSLY